MTVNAYTTLDLLDGRSAGRVSSRSELDSTELERLPAYADSLTLSPE